MLKALFFELSLIKNRFLIYCCFISHIYSVININFIEWSGIVKIARKELKRVSPVIPARTKRLTGPALHAISVMRKETP